LRAVLAAGASVAKPDANGGTPLHYAAQMCGASHDSKQQASSSTSSRLSLEILGILLSHPQSSVDVQDKDGRQPLLWAASAGSAKAVIALVKAGARVESSDKWVLYITFVNYGSPYIYIPILSGMASLPCIVLVPGDTPNALTP